MITRKSLVDNFSWLVIKKVCGAFLQLYFSENVSRLEMFQKFISRVSSRNFSHHFPLPIIFIFVSFLEIIFYLFAYCVSSFFYLSWQIFDQFQHMYSPVDMERSENTSWYIYLRTNHLFRRPNGLRQTKILRNSINILCSRKYKQKKFLTTIF